MNLRFWSFRKKRSISEDPTPIDKTKYIFIADSNGNANAYSPEEIMSKGLNHWAGWYCSAGVENIFINGSGDYYIGACYEGGVQGNVFKGGNDLRSEWYQCQRQMCHCGADMQLRRARRKELIPLVTRVNPTGLKYRAKAIETPEIVGRIFEQDRKLNLNWDIGRRCNYDCSYCDPRIHNNHERHRTWDELKFAVDEIERFFCQGQKTKWVFTGGEPTLNPDFLRVVNLINTRGHFVHTQSNGSRLPQYYEELLRVSLIGFSYHLEFAKPDRFLAKIDHLLKLKAQHNEYRWQWLGVRIMTGPGNLEKALEIKTRLASLENAKELLNQLVLAPLFDGTATHVVDYKSGELETISQYT